MRVRLPEVAMNEADPVYDYRPLREASALHRQEQAEIDELAGSLGNTASSIAQDLFAIHCLSVLEIRSKKNELLDLAQRMSGLAAALSNLREAMKLCPQWALWNDDHCEMLADAMTDCVEPLERLRYLVNKADDYIVGPSLMSKGKASFPVLELGCQEYMNNALQECFIMVLRTTMAARYIVLAQQEFLNDEELPEMMRLIWAMDDAEFDEVRTPTRIPLLSKQMQDLPMPWQTRPPSPTRDTDSESQLEPPIMPATKVENNVHWKETPIWPYKKWAPPRNPQLKAYLELLGKRPKPDPNAGPPIAMRFRDFPVETPVRRCPPNPPPNPPPNHIPNHIPNPTLKPPSQSKPGTVSFGQPSVIKPTANTQSHFATGNTAAFTKYNKSDDNAFTTIPHLEAYILRPRAKDVDATVVWSHDIESLPLDQEAMQAHVRKFEAEPSIVDALLDLQSQELQLIQRRATQRHGTIVSAQHAKPADMATSMGTFQIKPVIFIIRTSNFLGRDNCEALKAKSPTIDATATAGGLTLDPTTSSGFALSNGPGHHLSSSEAFSNHLAARGEPCTHVEGTEQKGAFQHYQSITMNPQWHNKDRSLEEIRLADYDAGRKEPAGSAGISYPWDNTLPDRSKSLSEGVAGLHLTSSARAHIPRTGCFPTAQEPLASGSRFGELKPKNAVPFSQVVPDKKPAATPRSRLPQHVAGTHNSPSTARIFGQQPSLPSLAPSAGSSGEKLPSFDTTPWFSEPSTRSTLDGNQLGSVPPPSATHDSFERPAHYSLPPIFGTGPGATSATGSRFGNSPSIARPDQHVSVPAYQRATASSNTHVDYLRRYQERLRQLELPAPPKIGVNKTFNVDKPNVHRTSTSRPGVTSAPANFSLFTPAAASSFTTAPPANSTSSSSDAAKYPGEPEISRFA